jgi:fructose/tagatose bisphosphate aldolase
MYPDDSAVHAPGPREQRRDVPVTAIQHGFTSVMMDGSLKEDAKTPADYDYNVDDHPPR